MIGAALFRPARLPAVQLQPGERLVWQTTPSWRRIVLDVFHMRGVVLYFGLLLVANGVSAKAQHMSRAATFSATWPLVVAMLVTLLCVLLLAHVTWRSIQYTITTDRIVLQYGVALMGTLSIPHRAIATVSLRVRPDHTGDIPLHLRPGHKVNVLKTWPLVRPWRYAAAEPMLRGVPQAGLVATALSRSISAAMQVQQAPMLADAAD